MTTVGLLLLVVLVLYVLVTLLSVEVSSVKEKIRVLESHQDTLDDRILDIEDDSNGGE